MKIEKSDSITIQTKKEAITMIKKCLVVTLAALIVIFNVLPAQAYTELITPVTITATGTLSGVTVAFSVTSVAQGATPGVSAAMDFGTVTTNIADSGESLMIRAKTNTVNNRLIVYTDNNLNTTPHKVPTVDPNIGIDGGGLVGQTDPGYSVALFWGTKTVANNDPNTNTDYVFGDPSVPVEGGNGNCVYLVDKRHTMSFTTKSNVATSLDCKELYTFAGTLVPNTDNDGLYPQLWDVDLYDSATIHNDTTKVSPALYSTIATIAFGIGAGGSTDAGYYVASVPQLRTLATNDSITTRTSKNDGTAGTEMYIAIGGDYTSKPTQTYSTAKLYVALVNN